MYLSPQVLFAASANKKIAIPALVVYFLMPAL